MSKKLTKKKRGLNLDLDFEAEAVSPVIDAPNLQISFDESSPLMKVEYIEDEATRRRKIRQRQLALQAQAQGGTSVIEPTPTNLTASTTILLKPTPVVSTAQSTINKTAQIEQLFKSTQQQIISDDSDSSDSDNDVFTFLSTKQQQRDKQKAMKGVDLSSSSAARSIASDLSIIAEVSTAITEKVGENVENEKVMKNKHELPDDTDYIEDLQIDITAWRYREAQRVFREVEERMKQFSIE